MAQESDRATLENLEALNPVIDHVKRSHGLLSFRSRKLLSSLTKKSGVNEVEKRAAFPTAREEVVVDRSGTLAKESRSDERRKPVRVFWDPRRVESEHAKAKLRNQKTDAENLPIKELFKEQQKGVAPPKQQLPPKLKLLETFYEGLEAAVSLLRIRRQMCTFHSVCKTVELLSKRRFLKRHLAQIKHIFPEVLQLEYLRYQDPDTWTEKWDLRITLLPLSSDCAFSDSPLKGSAGQTSHTVRRRKEFHARLLKFSSSYLEGSDIPQDPLPKHPLSCQQSRSSPGEQPNESSSHINFDFSNDARGHTEAALGSSAESPTKLENAEDSFDFSIVKPSRDDIAIVREGTPHFPASFRPFFSVKHTTDAIEGAHPQFCSTAQVDEKPYPEPLCSVHETDTDANIETRVAFTSTPGNVELTSTPAAADYFNSSGNSSHFPPSFTPVFSVISNDQSTPTKTSVPSTPKLRHDKTVNSPVPVNTPPLFSPINSFRADQGLPYEASCKTPSTSSSSDVLPPKSQGIMRSLKFGSPVGPSQSMKRLDSDVAPRTPSVSNPLISSPTEMSPVRGPGRTFPSSPSSTPAHALHRELRTVIQASPFAPPSTPGSALEESFLSPVKNLKSRALHFDTPAKACSNGSNQAKSIGLDDTHLLYSPHKSNPPRYLSPSKYLTPNSPSTPALRTPVRVPDAQDVLYSPPKRTKFSRVLLFSKGDKEKDIENTNVSVTAACTMPTPSGAVDGRPILHESSPDDGYVDKMSATAKVLRHSVVKDMKGISESDLDIIRCLPLDLVQSVQEKERNIKDEICKDLAKQKRRQQMIGGVPKLFNQIRLIFQSLNRSVLPRNELLKSILASHPDITDKGEVEERLQLLVELASDWMTTRPSHTGELLYRIDKRADVVHIQKRLSCAC